MKRSLEERVEEVVREEISLASFDPQWMQMFQTEADFLRARLPNSIVKRIEHFGSTAIPGMTAKPIIDILIEVTSLEETVKQIVPILESEGYEYFWRTDVSPPYAWFIKRDSKGNRTHHLHFVERDSKLWERPFFRDYLIEFPELAGEYSRLKYELASKFPSDRVAYSKGKAAFIDEVTEKALRYYRESN